MNPSFFGGRFIVEKTLPWKTGLLCNGMKLWRLNGFAGACPKAQQFSLKPTRSEGYKFRQCTFRCHLQVNEWLEFHATFENILLESSFTTIVGEIRRRGEFAALCGKLTKHLLSVSDVNLCKYLLEKLIMMLLFDSPYETLFSHIYWLSQPVSTRKPIRRSRVVEERRKKQKPKDFWAI